MVYHLHNISNIVRIRDYQVIRKPFKKRFLNATEMGLPGDLTNLTKRMRKVDCPVCLSVIVLEAITNEGDVIFCPHCDAKLVVSSFNRRPTVRSVDLYRSA